MINFIKKWLDRQKIYNQTYRELSSLTVRELHDLGLTPDLIPYVASAAARGSC